MNRLDFPKEMLHNLYWDRMLTLEEVGRKLGCCSYSVRQIMIRHGIPTRNNSEAHKGKRPWNWELKKETDKRVAAYGETRSKKHDSRLTREELNEFYCNQKLSTPKIAKLINRSAGYVYAKMREFGIPPRTRKEAWGKQRSPRIKKICPACGKYFHVALFKIKQGFGKYCSRTCMYKAAESRTPWDKGKKLPEWVKQKLRGERPSISMENHPNWRGGKSFEPYGIKFNDELKESIKKRDDHECQMCHRREPEIKLRIHHIDYDKKNNAQSNLISLCTRCHASTNWHPEKWIEFFRGLL